MRKRLEITDRIRNSAFPCGHPQAVQGSEGHVEVCPELVPAPGLAFLERGIALCIAEFKFHEEPASVNVHDACGGQRQVVGEEDLVPAAIPGKPDGYLHLPPERLAVYGSRIALTAVELIVCQMEHVHVEVVHVHFAVIEFRAPRPSGSLPLVDVVQHGVIPETGDELQAQLVKSVDETFLGEERVCHNAPRVPEDIGGQASQRVQIPVYKVEAPVRLVRIPLLNLRFHAALVIGTLHGYVAEHGFHVLHVRHGLAAHKVSCGPSLLDHRVSGEHAAVRRLEPAEHDTLMAESVDDADAEYLKPPLGPAGGAGPEIARTGRMSAGLADIARINGKRLDADAVAEVGSGQGKIERRRIHAAFLEVAAIGLLIGRAECGKLREIGFLHHNKKNYRLNEQ